MSWLVASALGLSLQLMLPALIGALVGGLLVGIFQTATQISDEAIGFCGRLLGALVALYLMGGVLSAQLLSFAQRLWGGAEFY